MKAETQRQSLTIVATSVVTGKS